MDIETKKELDAIKRRLDRIESTAQIQKVNSAFVSLQDLASKVNAIIDILNKVIDARKR